MFKELISWAEPQYKNLPWRKKRTLYRTLVSEIMLQQTTVGTVLGKFEQFLNQFPTLEKLARATEEEVTIAWKGLGYYRRARNLKSAAEVILGEHKGKIPQDFDTLISINGIGAYTAQALLSIGLDQRGLAVDANLERVLSRLFAIETEKGLKLQKSIQELLGDSSFKRKTNNLSFRKVNEAIMDLGRVVCTLRNPKCLQCPLNKKCAAFELDRVADFPKVKEKKRVVHELNLVRVLVKKKDQLLVYKKNKNEWLSGQYEVPTFVIKPEKGFKQYPKWQGEMGKLKKLKTFKTGITKYKINNYILPMSYADYKKLKGNISSSKFLDIKLKEQNLSTSTFKLLKNQ